MRNMSTKIEINVKDLTTFLNYMLDKVEECYKEECIQSLQRFLKRNGVL